MIITVNGRKGYLANLERQNMKNVRYEPVYSGYLVDMETMEQVAFAYVPEHEIKLGQTWMDRA